MRWAAAAALLATLVISGCARERTVEGRLAPTFRLPDVRDDRPAVDLAALEGRPVVLNFLAAWCDPCRRELPLLVAASKDRRDEVAFVGVDVQDSRSRATDLLAETGVAFPVAYDPKAAVAGAYGVYARLPATFFIDGRGRVVEQVLGEIGQERLDAALRKLRAAP